MTVGPGLVPEPAAPLTFLDNNRLDLRTGTEGDSREARRLQQGLVACLSEPLRKAFFVRRHLVGGRSTRGSEKTEDYS